MNECDDTIIDFSPLLVTIQSLIASFQVLISYMSEYVPLATLMQEVSSAHLDMYEDQRIADPATDMVIAIFAFNCYGYPDN